MKKVKEGKGKVKGKVKKGKGKFQVKKGKVKKVKKGKKGKVKKGKGGLEAEGMEGSKGVWCSPATWWGAVLTSDMVQRVRTQKVCTLQLQMPMMAPSHPGASPHSRPASALLVLIVGRSLGWKTRPQ